MLLCHKYRGFTMPPLPIHIPPTCMSSIQEWPLKRSGTFTSRSSTTSVRRRPPQVASAIIPIDFHIARPLPVCRSATQPGVVVYFRRKRLTSAVNGYILTKTCRLAGRFTKTADWHTGIPYPVSILAAYLSSDIGFASVYMPIRTIRVTIIANSIRHIHIGIA